VASRRPATAPTVVLKPPTNRGGPGSKTPAPESLPPPARSAPSEMRISSLFAVRLDTSSDARKLGSPFV
jgi:hypothetical protein